MWLSIILFLLNRSGMKMAVAGANTGDAIRGIFGAVPESRATRTLLLLQHGPSDSFSALFLQPRGPIRDHGQRRRRRTGSVLHGDKETLAVRRDVVLEPGGACAMHQVRIEQLHGSTSFKVPGKTPRNRPGGCGPAQALPASALPRWRCSCSRPRRHGRS